MKRKYYLKDVHTLKQLPRYINMMKNDKPPTFKVYSGNGTFKS